MNTTVSSELASIFKHSWWVVLIRGIVAIIFAVMIWQKPDISVPSLVLFFGIYALVDGIFTISIGIAGAKELDNWWVLVLQGIMGILVGFITFYAPGITEISLLFYIAIWAISTGIFAVIEGFRLRNQMTGEWLLILSGIASVAFGVLLMANPGPGVLAVVSMIAGFALVYGILLIIFAFKSRKYVNAMSNYAN